MLKIHDLKQAEVLDRIAMQAVSGGVDYRAASKNSGYRKLRMTIYDLNVLPGEPEDYYQT